MSYILTCSSTTDLNAAYFEENGIPVVSFSYNIDGKDYSDDFGASIPLKEYYSRIAAGAMPKTSQVNTEQYLNFFTPLLSEGKDILHIEFSSGLSGSLNSALQAREQLSEQFPERKLLICDSLAASAGYGLFVDLINDKVKAGEDIDSVYNWAEENKLTINHWFYSTDLRHYKRGGRISATSAALGGLLGICPIMNVNPEGKLIPRTKARGKKNTVREVTNIMEARAENHADYSGKCFISHSACIDDARELIASLEQRIPKLKGKIQLFDIGTVIGAHTGPGTVALFFVGEKRVEM